MKKKTVIFHQPLKYGCQNPNLDPTILRFYNPTYPKRFGYFKGLYDRSGSVESYDSDYS